MTDVKECGNIKAINVSSVHKICSGQVVLTLATAVKELVENSLDAGASIIEVKLKEYGSELIDVVDNGHGVQSCDFQSLTLKHHTSKLEDFSDLSNVGTFGFRGEALSSLCALSNLSITTCYEDSNLGTRLDYDHNGEIVKTSSVSRQVGTTVSVQSLFSTLPVRHKEFLRNLRKEFGKMVHLLTAYCLVCVLKRITCINHTEKGRKTVVLATNGANTVRDNITCVFGAKQMNSLVEFIQKDPSEATLAEFYLSQPAESKSIFRLQGFVSSCAHGQGRSSGDRQFYFINGRPCDLSKVSKVVNEVYHSFNKHQYPFVFLDITLEKDAVDVNVTPDKRTIFIQHEKLLLATIKYSLLCAYDQPPSIINFSPSGITKDNKNLGSIASMFISSACREGNKSPSLSSLKRPSPCDSENSTKSVLAKFKSRRTSESSCHIKNHLANNGFLDTSVIRENSECDIIPTVSNNEKLCDMSDSSFQDMSRISTQMVGSAEDITKSLNESSLDNCMKESSQGNISINDISHSNEKGSDTENKAEQTSISEDNSVDKNVKDIKLIKSINPLANIMQFCRTPPEKSISQQIDALKNSERTTAAKLSIRPLNEYFHVKSVICDSNDPSSSSDIQVEEDKCNSVLNVTAVNDTKMKEQIAVDHPEQRRKRVTCVPFSVESLKEKLYNKGKSSSNSCEYRRFLSKILPSESVSAEDELRREISKDMFSKMEIIGQFNLGFVIARLKDDLFIIDQHATDEKYNYEILQKETILKTQKLITPQKLELTIVTESILLDNIDIFEKNGFKFNIEEELSPGHRVSLVSVPVNQNWSFGKEDVDELIFMLTDNSGRMCRPSRVNQMFASRACRKSVMIGTHLSVQDMKKLVCHMGEIEQPWNCPHGRPTLRHLFSLNILRAPTKLQDTEQIKFGEKLSTVK